jgi:hypothetical protein
MLQRHHHHRHIENQSVNHAFAQAINPFTSAKPVCCPNFPENANVSTDAGANVHELEASPQRTAICHAYVA